MGSRSNETPSATSWQRNSSNGHLLPSDDGPSGLLRDRSPTESSSNLGGFFCEAPLATSTPWLTSVMEPRLFNSFGALHLGDGGREDPYRSLGLDGNVGMRRPLEEEHPALRHSVHPSYVLSDEERRILMSRLRQNYLNSSQSGAPVDYPSFLCGSDFPNAFQFPSNLRSDTEQILCQNDLSNHNQIGILGRDLCFYSSCVQGSVNPLLRHNCFPLTPVREQGKIMQGELLQEFQMRKMRPQPAVTGNRRNLGDSGFYALAKDEKGCHLLRRIIEKRNPQQLDIIVNSVLSYVSRLAMDPNCSNLIQELLSVCTEQQRLRIVAALLQDRTGLVRISLDIHGKRVVQKLIEEIKTTPEQVFLVTSSLKDGFLRLLKDENGSHVLQCCLQVFRREDNEVFLIAAVRHCLDIAILQHGCCFLQCCIQYSTGDYREHLVKKITDNGIDLAQDTYGNYAVQFVLDQKFPSANAKLASMFRGNYVSLSKQKFSSNVVEKCLNVFGEKDRNLIISEILQVSQFHLLLNHPYANYVISAALENSEDPLHTALVDAILPHKAALETSPFCKRIFLTIGQRR
ncbi:putative pumilio homolog 8, chloroplastic [Typha angustifolia]|uniref:putative pumilio homolog 8, chloroplastic n=1 Tax=Typha angustifolia TaxID=59011 RepID=UPI003C2F0057